MSRFMDIVRDTAYLIIVVVFSSVLVFMAVLILALYGEHASLGMDLLKYGVVLVAGLFSVLIVALALLVIFGYIPSVIKEGEEIE